MNSDGTNAVNLTQHPADDLGAIYAPDGQRIAFFSNRDRATGFDLFVMQVNGQGIVNLTSQSPTGTKIGPVVWSIDGQALAVFMAPRWLIVPLDGATTSEASDLSPTEWDFRNRSPDGQLRVDVCEGSSIGNMDLCVYTTGGTPLNLTNSGYELVSNGRAWSPDGTAFTYSASLDAEGMPMIFIVSADGSTITALTDGTYTSADPSWRP
jgi:TolB protein